MAQLTKRWGAIQITDSSRPMTSREHCAVSEVTRLDRVSSLVTALVDRTPTAAAALDGQGSLLHTNTFFEALTGRSRRALERTDFVSCLVPAELRRSARSSIDGALAGETTTLTLTLAQPVGGSWIELAMDAVVLDEGQQRVLLLTVRGAQLVREASTFSAFEGQAHVVRTTPDDAQSPEPPAGAACGTVARSGVSVVASDDPDRFVLVRTQLLDDERSSIESITLDSCALAIAVRSRIERLGERAGLTARERDVLGLLVLGRTLEEIGTTLVVSRHTVKFHQANLLEKLGAESRFDLLRVLL
jgi:PAS domain S-box-containing protein